MVDFLFIIDILVGCIFTGFHILEEFVNSLLQRPYKSLTKKRVLLTGAGRGLGKELADQLAKEQCELILTDINEEGVRQTAEDINSRYGDNTAVYFKTDVADAEDIKRLNEKVKAIGYVDILINNAGIVASNSVLQHTDREIDRIIDVNLKANIKMVREFLPDMLENNTGHIVCISSVAAFSAAVNVSAYFASKYGVTGFMYCLREELRARKDNRIVTTLIHPSFLTPQDSNQKHWEFKSRFGSLNIPEVATAVVEAIKMEKSQITIPGFMYYMMHLVLFLPQKSIDLWRDIYRTEINRSETNKY
uniref:Short-chain dehydrogenase/reductase 3 n=1 Tax=Cacopsylla melanoneura TaxID=428564 RepID=A0A8D9E336_9HEMI